MEQENRVFRVHRSVGIEHEGVVIRAPGFRFVAVHRSTSHGHRRVLSQNNRISLQELAIDRLIGYSQLTDERFCSGSALLRHRIHGDIQCIEICSGSIFISSNQVRSL